MGLLEYLSHPRVNCFADDRLYSEESALAYISNTPKDMLRYAVCLKEDDFIIGDVFALREYTDTFSVGWHFNQRFEGKGLAYEAATEFLDYLFCDAGARRVYGFVEDVEKTEHAGTASGVEKCLKMAIGLKNTAIDYQIVAF